MVNKLAQSQCTLQNPGSGYSGVLVKPGMERNERNAREKFTHRRVTANVWVLTVCSTHTVPYKLQKSSMGSQESYL